MRIKPFVILVSAVFCMGIRAPDQPLPASGAAMPASGIAQPSTPQQPSKSEQKVWQPRIDNASDWRGLSILEQGAEFSKFVLDVKTGAMYFFDPYVFKLHIDFGLGVLLKQERTPENIKAFNQNYSNSKPQFILGYITHYPRMDLWTYSFWEGDTIEPADVLKTQRALANTFYIKDVQFRPDSRNQELMAKKLNKQIKVITNDKIYQQLPFQSFQTGEAVGIFKVVPVGAQLDDLYFERTDIVMLQEAYPDISPVSGIVTTQFSTPLAHVNLRASAWGIPNAGDKTAAQRYAALNGQVVYYKVTESGLELRPATPSEQAAFKAKKEDSKHVVLPEADLGFDRLNALCAIQAADVIRYGTKTANLGELVYKRANVSVPTGFGIPFYYYDQHIKKNGLQPKIDALLADPRFHTDSKADAVWRREALNQLKQAITDAPIQPADLQKITERWQKYLGGKGVFVRSSTNAEDLKGFNGAGLYDTVPNVKTQEAMDAAIKKVWASIWNERAVNERELAGIDHQKVYPGVLVQTGVNATAAGVLLTTDIWGHNPNTYTINAKWGLGIRVVEGQKVPEQVLYDSSNYGTRIISRSSENTMLVFDPKNGVQEVATPGGDTILTEARARRLGDEVARIIPMFSKDTALDIEWVLEGEKVWIVQVRPYVTKANPPQGSARNTVQSTAKQ